MTGISQSQLTSADIERIFGVAPVDLELYRTALTHSSVSETANYETLEFLGDACLSFCVATYLFSKFPEGNQGFLTITRSKIVNTESLGNFANKLGLAEFVIISEEFFERNSHHSHRVLEDVFEALIGALYTEHGMMHVKRFVIDTIERFVDWDDIAINRNYKEQLMWYTQQTNQSLPVYKDDGRDEETRTFTVSIDINGHRTHGTHRVKKQAQQLAAKNMLKKLGIDVQ